MGSQALILGLVLYSLVSNPSFAGATCSVHLRVVGLEGASRLGEVGTGLGGLKGAGARGHEMVLNRGSVDRVADPGVPSGLDLAGVVVVLGVFDPAGAQGQLLHVLEELVAGAVSTDVATELGITCKSIPVSVLSISLERFPGLMDRHEVCRGFVPMYCSRASGRWSVNWFLSFSSSTSIRRRQRTSIWVK